MKNKLIFVFIFLAASQGAFAFVNTITYPPFASYALGQSFVTESPGIYALIGHYDDPTYSSSGFLARLDSSGNSITINTTPSYDFYDGIKTPGGYTVLAYFTSPSYDYSSEIIKLDATGNCLSVKMLNGQDFHTGSLCSTPDNGIVAGVDYYGVSRQQAFLERYDSSGNSVWARAYDYYIYLYKIICSSDGGFFVGGEGPSSGAFVMKVDSSGNSLWAWEDAYIGRIYNMTAAENGSVIAAGYTNVTGVPHVLAVKIDASGNPVWKNEIKNIVSSTTEPKKMQIIPAAGVWTGYVLSGVYVNEADPIYPVYNMFALQIDNNGNTSNFKGISTVNDTYNGFCQAISGNHFILAGVDYNYRIVTADYTTAVYQSVPVPGGASSDRSYACPQPAKDFVRFVYALQDRATVTINIYNFANRLIGQNVSAELPADNVTTQVDTSKLSSGVYFYQIVVKPDGKAEKRLKAGEFIIKK